jgi:DNA excision repair protein ERCC-4
MMIVIDTREQRPLIFGGDVQTVSGTLETGDYSVAGMEEQVTVERKSLPDLVMCVSWERDRFWRELDRMARMPMAAIMVEAPLSAAVRWQYRADVHPHALLASCMAMQCDYGVPVIWCGDRTSGAAWVLAYLRLAVKRYEGGTVPGAQW